MFAGMICPECGQRVPDHLFSYRLGKRDGKQEMYLERIIGTNLAFTKDRIRALHFLRLEEHVQVMDQMIAEGTPEKDIISEDVRNDINKVLLDKRFPNTVTNYPHPD